MSFVAYRTEHTGRSLQNIFRFHINKVKNSKREGAALGRFQTLSIQLGKRLFMDAQRSLRTANLDGSDRLLTAVTSSRWSELDRLD